MLRYQGGLKSKLLPMAVWKSDVFKEVVKKEARPTRRVSGVWGNAHSGPRMKENIRQCEIHRKRMYDCQVP